MPREKASRKYQLTFNNPLEHGFSHESIKNILSGLKLEYWCMCDEIGLEEKTPHTHLYIAAKNPIMFSTLHTRFYGAHIEMARGSSQENRDYIRKEGKYSDSEKKETNLPETFEEYGLIPIERVKSQKVTDEVYQMIKDGCSDVEITDRFPSFMTKLPQIEQMRQRLNSERFSKEFRKLNVIYISGDSGVGKTRSVFEKFGYGEVYRVSDYGHPFDNYKAQDVLVLDEFRSSLPITLILNILDGYPLDLPSRYTNKVACYSTVIIISNIPINMQYPNVQTEEPETWNAFLRRINSIIRLERNNGQYAFAELGEVVEIEESTENYRL